MLKSPRVLLPLGLLALLAGYVLAFPPLRLEATHLASCPMVLAGFPGTQLDLTQAVLDDLDPDDYLIRRYDRPDGTPVWLTIVYFQNARLGAHDPKTCYRSAGFEVQDLPPGGLATSLGQVPFEGFRAVKGPRRELVRYFWYTAGGKVLPDVKSWRDDMFFQGVRSNRSFGAFVRVSTLEGADPGAARQAVEAVMTELATLLPGFFPEKGAGGEGKG